MQPGRLWIHDDFFLLTGLRLRSGLLNLPNDLLEGCPFPGRLNIDARFRGRCPFSSALPELRQDVDDKNQEGEKGVEPRHGGEVG